MEKRVIVIVGPTCSGKTFLSLLLAENLNSEIISADSRQVYKLLDIGTAKPSNTELKKIKHHFVDELNPEHDFNASRFEEDSIRLIKDLHQKNKIPIVAGGSGLYIKALVDGIFNSVGRDDKYRKELLNLKNEHGNEYLYELLMEKDPESAANMLPQNWKRVMRALEVFHLSGKPIGEFQNKYVRETGFEFLQFGLEWERSELYSNIEKRVDEMIESGLIEEVQNILRNGYSSNINALNTVGYKEIIYYLDGEVSLERAVELIKRNTRRFAKRQMTWFRKDERIKWLKISGEQDLINSAEMIRNAVVNNEDQTLFQ